MNRAGLRYNHAVFHHSKNFRLEADLTLEPGKLSVILGPSGSGKTTLLDLAAGFLRPHSGRIEEVRGERVTDISRLPPEKRRTGVVFQDFALFPHLDVLQNVAFGPRMRGESRQTAARRATECLELMNMSAFARRRPASLSGGEKQRIALARALAIRPDILLLDEPFNALDAALRRALREEVKQIQRQTGVTAVLVTHDQEEALAMADTLVLMRQGRIVEHGTPAELWQNPSGEFTAAFLGESLKLRVLEMRPLEGGACRLRTAAGEITLEPSSLSGQYGQFGKPARSGRHEVCTDRPARLYIRPEELEVHPQGELSGRVCGCEYAGGFWKLRLKAEGHSGSAEVSGQAGGCGDIPLLWPDKTPPEKNALIRFRLKKNGKVFLLPECRSDSESLRKEGRALPLCSF